MSDPIGDWASEWMDTFDQTWKDETLRGYVGKTVRTHVETDDGPKGAVVTVIGYSRDTLVIRGTDVHRFSFITNEGLQIPLFSGMEIEEVE